MGNFNDELTLESFGNSEVVKDNDADKPQEDNLKDISDNDNGIDFEPDLGDEDTKEDKAQSSNGDNDTPNVYSSIALSLKEDGVLNLLDADEFKSINDADDLALLFKKQIDSMLDDRQKRIDYALGNGVEADTVKQYENLINYVNSLSDDKVKDESDEGETLRMNIIIQDYLNKGIAKEKAEKLAKKTFDSGTDIEDAIEALSDLKSFYKKEYDGIIEKSKKEKEDYLNIQKENNSKIEKMFLENAEPVKGIKLSETDRKKMFSQYSKFVDKDVNNKPLNAIQKYAVDNPLEYQYNINMLFYMTDGFKDLSRVINKEARKEVKSALSNIENVIKNPKTSFGDNVMDFGNDKSDESKISVSFD